MAHPVVFTYLSYSTTFAEHAFVAYVSAQPSAGLGHVCSRLFNVSISHVPNEWPHDHGRINVGAMVKKKKYLNINKRKQKYQTR